MLNIVKYSGPVRSNARRDYTLCADFYMLIFNNFVLTKVQYVTEMQQMIRFCINYIRHTVFSLYIVNKTQNVH